MASYGLAANIIEVMGPAGAVRAVADGCGVAFFEVRSDFCLGQMLPPLRFD
jgi:hypothetical protein